jgi:hypothetical protein
MPERDAIAAERIAASKVGARLFRNNVGVGWVGHVRGRGNGVVILHDARPLHAGLCEGSSDLIGWTPRVITQDMVGQTVAVFTAVEVKTGRVPVTGPQQRFLDAVTAAGGIGRVIRS